MMNCLPAPLPTFLAPLGSNGGPPAEATAGAVAGSAVAATVGGAAAAPELKPQPVLPAWNCAPGPEQMPVGFAQQPLPQSALLRHWPPMNCCPAPLPTFLSPDGSNGGAAYATRATTSIQSAISNCSNIVAGLWVAYGSKEH